MCLFIDEPGQNTVNTFTTKSEERPTALRGGDRVPLYLLLLGAGLFFTVSSPAQALRDSFANRLTYTSDDDELNGSNTAATIEPNEPLHGGKPGGHSLWISWIAPKNGVVKFKTEGSRFDTLLSIYRFVSPTDTTLDKLVLVASADDSEGFERESEVEFGVIQGWRYEIAVDGYRGLTGRLELEWDLTPTISEPPVLIQTPQDRSAAIGEPVTLTVAMTNLGNAQLKWYFNNLDLDATTTNLLIPSMQVTNVGRYKLRVTVDGEQFFTPYADLQINTDGSSNTLAQPKFLDAPASPLIGAADGEGSSVFRFRSLMAGGGGGKPMQLGVVRGYNGSQIFNTTYATTDPNEPPHCDVPGGASYWLVYQPPTNGTITLDTLGSSYDTVMEVYSYSGTPTNYSDLIKIDCNDNAFGTNGASRVIVPVVKTRQYLLAVDGVAGGRGVAWLNYRLNTNQLPQSPLLTATPANRLAAPGATVVLNAPVTGSPPLMFTWCKDGIVIPGASGGSLVLANLTTNSTASYSFSATNDLGGPAASEFALTVVEPPACALTPITGALRLSFPTITGPRYIVEEAEQVAGPWTQWPNFSIGDGQPVQTFVPVVGSKYYRVRVE